MEPNRRVAQEAGVGTGDRSMPFLSIVIPIFDSPETLDQCLASLLESTYQDFEVLVGDDASPDGAGIDRVCRRYGAKLVRLAKNSGPGAARNAAARAAQGRVLVFIDADVTVHADTLARLAQAFQQDAGLDAVMGSYDLNPKVTGVVAVFRNLLHAHVHSRSSHSASTFWTGCGAVRLDRFLELGGMDETPGMLDDVEFGMRLHKAGGRLGLDPSIQVSHHKRWTLRSMILTDVFGRGIPWTELMMRYGLPRDLNFRWQDRLCTASAAAILPLLVLALRFGHIWWALAAGAISLVGLLEWPLFRFFARERGLGFAVSAFPLYVAHLLAGTTGLVLGLIKWEQARDRWFPWAGGVLAVLSLVTVAITPGHAPDFAGHPSVIESFAPGWLFGDFLLQWPLLSPIALAWLVGFVASVLFYRIARWMVHSWAALFGASLLAMAPIWRINTPFAMADLLAILFGVLMLKALIRFCSGGNRNTFIEAAGWCGLGLPAAPTNVCLVPALFVAIGLSGRWKTLSPRRLAALTAGGVVAVCALYSIAGFRLSGATDVSHEHALAGWGIVGLAGAGMLAFLARPEPATIAARAVVISVGITLLVWGAPGDLRHWIPALPALLLSALICLGRTWGGQMGRRVLTPQ
jgi:GT2 family glycosyltransferase